jgi:quinol monooxygenase YgiN
VSVVEVVRVQVAEGRLHTFLADVEAGLLGLLSDGVPTSAEVLQGVESPDACLIVITWDSVESHENYRSTPEFKAFYAAMGAHLAGTGGAEHYERRVSLTT